MIQIKVDKESEMLWLTNVISAGTLNLSNTYTLEYLGVPLKQSINYKQSDEYIDDVKEKREEYNNRFANSGLRRMDIENILKKEYKEKHR